MSSDNYLIITKGAVVYEGQGEGPCPYSGQRPLVICKNIAVAILFCEDYQRQEIVEYGYSLTEEAQEQLRKETGNQRDPCPTCHQAILNYDAEGFPTNL